MIENDVIIVDGFSNDEFDALTDACIRYAIISKPFTIRRIDRQSLQQAVLNIFKGKLAEALFRCFCEKNNIILDWVSPSTPFWKIDKRDFIYQQTEWDIKNNYIYHSHDILHPYHYTDLPALIPNRKQGDQWDKRLETKNPGICNSVGHIFTFIRGANIENGKRGNDFYTFEITREQLELIERAEKKYGGHPVAEEPFKEDRFWAEMKKRGGYNFIKINFRPFLIITAYATANHWHFFRDTGPLDISNHYQSAIQPQWYSRSPKGSVNFLNGTLWPTITNATAPIHKLPSFASLFPQLKDTIVYGKFKESGKEGNFDFPKPDE
jgi:hypothetical protein